MQNNLQTAVFGGGCFWCTEAIFLRLKGVESVIPGYAGGSKEKPSYEEVSSGQTGHAEVIKIQFNPEVINFESLLNVFFVTHDPTTMNSQGSDLGTQYRSVIFYTNDDQKIQTEKFIEKFNQQKIFPNPVVTQVKPLNTFFEAEDYHHNYYENNKDNNPYCQVVINPKLSKLKEKFSLLLK